LEQKEKEGIYGEGKVRSKKRRGEGLNVADSKARNKVLFQPARGGLREGSIEKQTKGGRKKASEMRTSVHESGALDLWGSIQKEGWRIKQGLGMNIGKLP